MINSIRLVAVFVIFFCFHTTQAQQNKNKDFFNIKAPAIEYTTPNPNDVLFEEDLKDSSGAAENYEMGPVKEPNLLEDEEDTVFFDDANGELSVEEVNEE